MIGLGAGVARGGSAVRGRGGTCGRVCAARTRIDALGTCVGRGANRGIDALGRTGFDGVGGFKQLCPHIRVRFVMQGLHDVVLQASRACLWRSPSEPRFHLRAQGLRRVAFSSLAQKPGETPLPGERQRTERHGAWHAAGGRSFGTRSEKILEQLQLHGGGGPGGGGLTGGRSLGDRCRQPRSDSALRARLEQRHADVDTIGVLHDIAVDHLGLPCALLLRAAWLDWSKRKGNWGEGCNDKSHTHHSNKLQTR